MNSLILPWIVFLGVMALLFERKTRWISRFSIFTPVLSGFFLVFGVAVPFNDNVNAAVTGVPISHAALLNYYLALALVYVGIYAGVGLIPGLQAISESSTDARRLRPAVLILAATVVLALVVTVWIILPWDNFRSGLSVFTSLHTSNDYRIHRAEYGVQTSPSVSFLNYLGAFARFAILPVLIWILYSFRRRSLASSALFGVSIIVLGLIGLASGQKAPALLLVLGFLFAWLISSGRSLFNWKFLAVGAMLIGIVVPVLYHFQYPELRLGSLYQDTVYRLTGEYSRTAQLRFMFYPKIHPFLFGQSSSMVRRLLGLFGFHDSGAQSPESYLADKLAVGEHGTWNAGFFADAWADFGFAGVVVASVLVGIILALIFRWYMRGPKGPLETGTYVSLCISAFWLTTVSLPTVLWTYGLFSGLVVYWLLRLTGKSPDIRTTSIDEPPTSLLAPRTQVRDSPSRPRVLGLSE